MYVLKTIKKHNESEINVVVMDHIDTQELALLHHSTRTATVVSQDNVQLLAIGRDDFFDIFMSGQGPGEIPQHIAFIRWVIRLFHLSSKSIHLLDSFIHYTSLSILQAKINAILPP